MIKYEAIGHVGVLWYRKPRSLPRADSMFPAVE